MISERSQSLEDTGERMVPQYHKGSLIYAEHWTRYVVAENVVKGKSVLDIACGSGYGSHVLAQWAEKVVGIDYSEDAIGYCRQNYDAPNIEYKTGDAANLPLADGSVDVVVTYETIEHIEDYRKFLTEIKRVLRPDGVAIVSTPNDVEFAEGNHFHLHEFEYEELMTLLKAQFKYTKSWFQTTWKSVVIAPESVMNTEGKVETELWNIAPVSPDQYLYFMVLCSDEPIDVELPSIAALGGHYSDRKVMEEHLEIVKLQDHAAALVDSRDELARDLAGARQELATTREQLDAILGSRAYKLASSMTGVKRRLGVK